MATLTPSTRVPTLCGTLIALSILVGCGDDDAATDAGTDAGPRDARVSDARGADSSGESDGGQCMDPPDPTHLLIYGNNFSVVQLGEDTPQIISQMREEVAPPEPRMRIGSCVQHSLYDSIDWYRAPDVNYGDVRFGNDEQYILFVRELSGPSMDPLRAPYPTYIANTSSYAGFAGDEMVTVEFLGETTAEGDAGVVSLDGGVSMASATVQFPPDVTPEEIVIPGSWTLGEPLVIELNLPSSTPRDAFVFVFAGGRGHPGGINTGGREQIYLITCTVPVCASTLEIPAELRVDFGGTAVPTRQFAVGLARVVPIEGAPLGAMAMAANGVFQYVTLAE